jgi:hypothetical protein
VTKARRPLIAGRPAPAGGNLTRRAAERDNDQQTVAVARPPPPMAAFKVNAALLPVATNRSPSP